MKIYLTWITFSLVLLEALSSRLPEPRREAIDCQVCQYVMEAIRHETVDKTLPPKVIKQKLNRLYKSAPSNLKNEYLTNLDVFIALLSEGKDPETICRLLGKCPALRRNGPDITECEVCTAVVDLIKFEITVSNATIQVIIKAVEALCALIGDVPVYEECKFILGEINQIIQWLEEELTPTDICQRLGLCPNTTHSAISNEAKTLTCRTVVRNIRIQSRSGWSEERMEGKIIPICRKLGLNTFHCSRIKSNLGTVLDMIRQGQEPEEVCGHRIKINDIGVRSDPPSNYCEFCMMIMENVNAYLEDLQTGLKAIEAKLDGMCNELEDLSGECKYVVNVVFEDLERNLKYIEGSLDPSAACKVLKLCPASLG